MASKVVLDTLKGIYARLLGKLQWLEDPPKSMARSWRGGVAFREGAADRSEQIGAVKVDLERLGHVIRMLEPKWDQAAVTAVRPMKARGWHPSGGWARAALRVMRDGGDGLTIAELVEAIAADGGEELGSVSERQRCHTALSNSFRNHYSHVVVEVPGDPGRWFLQSADD